jgi:uncharacterized protein (TIGR02246 family)
VKELDRVFSKKSGLQINKKARIEMKPSTWISSVLCVVIVACGAFSASAADPAAGKAAIEKAVASYVAAFNAGDAKALAALWSPEGVYTSRLSGDQVVGREALEKDFAALFVRLKGAKLKVSTESIDFVSPNVAVEQGRATVLRPKDSPLLSDYRAVYVRRDGKWLIDRISEDEEVPARPSHYEHLKDLEWLVGNWIDQDGGAAIKTECQWTRNKNFLTRSFTVSIEDRIDVAGMQVIGWDAARKQIRSWVFDSEGGFVEGVWKKSGDRWTVTSTATLADGKTGSFTSISRPLDENSFGWQKVNRIADGEILPNIDEVVIVRQGAQQ